MENYWSDSENIIQTGRIKVPYTWQAGETASYYFTQLRDEKKIFGKQCPKCDIVLTPPRKTCPFCMEKTTEWVELSGEGKVETFTIVRERTNVSLMDPPFVYAIIALDGAGTNFLHALGEVDVETVEEGMRVKAVFSQKRVGLPTDIAYFKPIG